MVNLNLDRQLQSHLYKLFCGIIFLFKHIWFYSFSQFTQIFYFTHFNIDIQKISFFIKKLKNKCEVKYFFA